MMNNGEKTKRQTNAMQKSVNRMHLSKRACLWLLELGICPSFRLFADCWLEFLFVFGWFITLFSSKAK